jgi:hypothetical protein
VDLDRNLFYVDHLSSLTFDLLQNLLGGRCKSVARSYTKRGKRTSGGGRHWYASPIRGR